MAPVEGLFGKYKAILAPMAGVTDVAFRSLCREQGADLAYTEMVSAKGLSYANDKTRHLVDLGEGENEVAVQLFGHEPQVVADMAAWVEQELGSRLVLIDINMGCPARKIVSKGDGSALMKDVRLASDIVSACKRSVEHPVTCKFRRGWSDDAGETAPQFARAMADSGADAVTVHGRFSTQMYRGDADWGTIARVKQAVSVPVVGNGDVTCGDDAVRMAAQTGCDAVMVARGAEGNPWVFADVRAALDGRDVPEPPSPAERLGLAKRHVAMLAGANGGRVAPMRKHAAWYVHGLPGAAAARGRFNECCTVGDFDEVFDQLLEVCNAA